MTPEQATHEIEYLHKCLNDAYKYGHVVKQALLKNNGIVDVISLPETEYYYESRSMLEAFLYHCYYMES